MTVAFADKIKKLIKSRAFLFKLVLTIFAFICIPLLAVQIFVIGRSTNAFQKNNQEYYLSVLRTSANAFTSREDMLSQMALRLGNNEDVRKPLKPPVTEYTWYEAAQALHNYSTAVPYAQIVGVYYPTNGFLLAGEYKFTLANYCAYIEPEEPEKALRMEDFFKNLVALDYYASSDGNWLFIARPVSLGVVGRNDAIAFFVMDAKALEQSYQTSVALRSSFAIVDQNSTVLIKGEDFVHHISEKDLSDFLASSNSVCTIDAENDLMVYKYTQPESGYTFLLSVNKDESQEQLLDFARLIRITMYVAMFLMGIALAVTIYINYLPIHQLLKKHTRSIADRETHSEIECLEAAFFKLDEKNSTQEKLLTDLILGDLLFGNAVKPDLVNQCFPEGSFGSFAVATALCPALTADQSRSLAEKITELTGNVTYITSVPSRPHTVIICLNKMIVDPDRLRDGAAQAIESILGVQCLPCVGEVVSDIHTLRASYRSAVTGDKISEQAEPGENAAVFQKKLQVLSQCVYMGDKEEALSQLNSIKRFLNVKAVGEGHRRYYCFKLLHSYLSSIDTEKSRLSGQEVELLLSFSSIEHLFKLLSESIHQICDQVADTERTTDAQLQQKLLHYVDDNFRDSSICLTVAANYMKTSIYAVSRLFKEITGKGFKDYVTEKRLEYGHHLLCNTQKSIAEISAESGFENANYFSTVFKQKYGVPPTKYRNSLKETQPTQV